MWWPCLILARHLRAKASGCFFYVRTVSTVQDPSLPLSPGGGEKLSGMARIKREVGTDKRISRQNKRVTSFRKVRMKEKYGKYHTCRAADEVRRPFRHPH